MSNEPTYRHKGGHYWGVASRDYTVEQYNQLSASERRIIRNSGGWSIPKGEATKTDDSGLNTPPDKVEFDGSVSNDDSGDNESEGDE